MPRLPLCAVMFAMSGLAGAWGQDEALPQLPAPAPAAELPMHLTFATAETLLLAHHQGIAASRAGSDAARAGEALAGYRPNPTLSLGAEQFDLRAPHAHWGSDSGQPAQRTWTVHVEQVFERGDKRALRSSGALQQRLAAEAQEQDAARQARLALAQAFTAALLARDNLVVADENVALGATTEQLVAKQVEGGNRSAADLLSFQVNRVQYLQDQAAARLDHDQALQDIAALIGLAAPVGFDVSGDLATALPETPAGDAAISAGARADVLAARHAADAAGAAVRLAEALRSADATFGLEYQRVGSDNTIGVTSSIPLAAWNNHQADVLQAEALWRQAEAQYAQARRQAEADIAKALLGLSSTRALLGVYSQETLAKAKRALDIATTAYQGGATGLLEVLDAQRTYNQFRVATNQALANVRLAAAQLAAATGRAVGGGGG